MKPANPRPDKPVETPEPEVQQGHGRSIAKGEKLERLIKQHPQRDEPRVDSVEPGETPQP